jgi:hypothetical protein
VQLPQEEIDRRRERWTGLLVGAVLYLGDLLVAWWLLGALHYGKQQFLAVPLLAVGFLLLEGFALRKASDKLATGFVLSGFCILPLALFIIWGWLQNSGFVR